MCRAESIKPHLLIRTSKRSSLWLPPISSPTYTNQRFSGLLYYNMKHNFTNYCNYRLSVEDHESQKVKKRNQTSTSLQYSPNRRDKGRGAHLRNQYIHSSYSLAIIIKTHIKCFEVFRVVIHNYRLLVHILCQISAHIHFKM